MKNFYKSASEYDYKFIYKKRGPEDKDKDNLEEGEADLASRQPKKPEDMNPEERQKYEERGRKQAKAQKDKFESGFGRKNGKSLEKRGIKDAAQKDPEIAKRTADLEEDAKTVEARVKNRQMPEDQNPHKTAQQVRAEDTGETEQYAKKVEGGDNENAGSRPGENNSRVAEAGENQTHGGTNADIDANNDQASA